MKRTLLSVLFVLGTLSALAVERPSFLLRVERLSDLDRGDFAAAQYDVAAEMASCLLVRGGKAEVDKLEAAGHAVTLLDSDPLAWDYYIVGLRPDSDMAALNEISTVLHAEENWVLLRTVPGVDLARLYGARCFVAPLPKEPMAPPRGDLGSDPVAFRRPVGPQHAVPLVQQMVNSVNTADIDSYWTAVTTNPPTGTRFSSGTGCTDAANYVLGQFNGLGLQSRNIIYNAGHAPNTEGQITGAVNPSVIYIVEGHIDDLPNSGAAPGADDNASGSVNVLEAAKVLSCYAFKNTVRFLTVSGEEAGLLGSTAYANASYSLGENIQGVINMDMPGWAGDNLPASGENLDLNYDSNSTSLGTFYAQCATDYSTGLPVDAFLCPSLNASDHYQFWVRGYKAVCGITDNEGYCSHAGNYPYYHTVNDTIANCGAKTFFYRVARTTIAALAELGEPFKITLDKTSYGCTVPVQVIVGDKDLNTNATTIQTTTIQIRSTRESTPESLILTEQGVNSMIFSGTINLTGVAPVHGDGLLSVNTGDAITADYVDALDCNGAANVSYSATGSVSSDCVPPVITNVLVTNITDTTATVTWTTDEAANSRVTFGLATPPATNKDDLATYVTSHSVTVTGLTACTKYYFSVTSADAVGNSATNANGGVYYSFTSAGRTFLMGPDTVEGGVLSWVASPATGTDIWHQDTCKAVSGTHSWKVGKSDAPTCTGQYASSLANYFLTWNANINLGAAGHGYHLQFNEWYDTESNTGCTYDPIRTQISTDGGTTWATLATNCGASGGWLARDYNLAAYTGSTVRIRFTFASDSSGNGLGWFVDDINISKSESCTAEATYQSNTFADACSGTGTGVGNGFIDPGEDITLHPTLKNTGSQAATGISATLSTLTAGITVTGATATYPDLAAGASAACDSPHFVYSVGTGVACGTVINFTLTITAAAGGGPWTQNFTATVGQVLPGGGTLLSETFDTGVTPPALPAGWATAQVSGTAGAWATNAGTHYPSGGGTNTSPNVGYFNSFSSSSGSSTRFYRTAGVSIPASATACTLSFYMYHDTGYTTSNDTVQPQVSTNGGTVWINVGTAIPRYAATAAWTLHTLSLATYIGQADVRLAFLGTSAYGNDCHIDTVLISYTATGGCNVSACTPAPTTPGETAPGDLLSTAQTWTSLTEHQWPANAQATNGYKVVLGTPAQLPYLLNATDDSCVKWTGATTSCTLSDTPATGSFYWYLVIGVNGAGDGHPGFATGPVARVLNSTTGACP